MDNNLQILYDHYEDTFQIITRKETLRGRHTVLCGILLAALAIIEIEPQQASETFAGFLSCKVGVLFTISFSHVQSALWVALLYSLANYYSSMIQIERSYDYLHKLEKCIAELMKIDFSREGASYLNNYPLTSNIIYYIYTAVLPVIFVFIIVWKNIGEFNDGFSNIVFDLVISAVCLALLISYLAPRITQPIKKFLSRDNA